MRITLFYANDIVIILKLKKICSIKYYNTIILDDEKNWHYKHLCFLCILDDNVFGLVVKIKSET